MMRNIHVEEDELLVSFDVTSLFANISIDEAVHLTYKRLLEDETLDERTFLSPDRVMELLERCLRTTYMYFSYRGTSMSRWRVQQLALQSLL